jgi:pimeloyl-ACP methyl ester carboxylesterase
MAARVVFLGGNGHSAARLAPARTALARLVAEGRVQPFELTEPAFPGFEDRPRAPDFEAFLDAISPSLVRAGLVYGTGIGGLIALCLRARGIGLDSPLLLQAPVLWGLERRWMPRLLRLGPFRFLLQRLFAQGWFQDRFVRKQFERPPTPGVRAAFFDGYARCPAAADFFAWLTPALLRRLETHFARNPEALGRIAVWWGERDRVVTLQELAWTERALGLRWPVSTFPHWGHYPMIDEPEDWVRTLADALATPGALP